MIQSTKILIPNKLMLCKYLYYLYACILLENCMESGIKSLLHCLRGWPEIEVQL